MKKKITWSDIYLHWKYVCEHVLYSSIVGKTEIVKVETPRYSPYGLCRDHFDWWPKRELEARKKDESEQQVWGWGTRPGLLSTAYMLAEYQNDIERQHATYILASLWSKRKHLPETWYGSTCMMLEDVMSVAISQHREIYFSWHHGCKETLPINIMDYPGYKVFAPKDEHDIIYLVALETALCHASWQVIEFIAINDQKRTHPNLSVL